MFVLLPSIDVLPHLTEMSKLVLVELLIVIPLLNSIDATPFRSGAEPRTVPFLDTSTVKPSADELRSEHGFAEAHRVVEAVPEKLTIASCFTSAVS